MSIPISRFDSGGVMKNFLVLLVNIALLVMFPAVLILLWGGAFAIGLLWQVFGDALKGR